LTTLRGKHVNIRGDTIRFHFVGKSGKQWNLSVHDRRIAATIKRCSELPGYDIFKYIGEAGSIHEISSGDVNSYLKEITKRDFTAKDYRTWSGTVLAALALQEVLTYDSQSEAKKNVVAAIEKVAKRLGNTPSICRKCYVHPEIVNAYMSGELAKMTKMKLDAEFRAHLKHLSRDEVMVLAFLSRRLPGQRRGRRQQT
jgi:DNA topoisomerase-1